MDFQKTHSTFKKKLLEKLEGARKIVVLGTGNPELPYDSLGLILSRELEKLIVSEKKPVFFFHAETLPENFTGPIKKLAPTHLILIDSASFNMPPYFLRIIEGEELDDLVISCHKQPFSMMESFLRSSLPSLTVFAIGIQTLPSPSPEDKLFREALGIIYESLKTALAGNFSATPIVDKNDR